MDDASETRTDFARDNLARIDSSGSPDHTRQQPDKLLRTSIHATIRARHPSAGTLRGLDWLNFFLADVQTGVGPFLAIYLAGYHWDEQQVGVALTVGGITGIVMQTPAGALVDRLRCKRGLIAGGVAALAIGALLIALFPLFWPVMAAQVLIGGTSCVFIPAICAMSLGIVGARAFDCRQGRNQAFNAAGNVAAAVVAGAIGWFISDRAVFLFVVVLALPTFFSLTQIRSQEIDHELARAAVDGKAPASGEGKLATVWSMLKDRPLLIFLACAVLFHFANAAMLPLLGEMLAKGKGRGSMFFMSACVVTTQLTITLLASWSGRKASTWGRKPLLLIGFGVLPILCRAIHAHQCSRGARRHSNSRWHRGRNFQCRFDLGDCRLDARHGSIQSDARRDRHRGRHRCVSAQSGDRRSDRASRRISNWVPIPGRGGCWFSRCFGS